MALPVEAHCRVPDRSTHHRFGPFELQPLERRLLKDGVAVPLRPRAFDLLTAMVDRAGHLVTKDELFERVWPGVIVEEAALQMQVSALRKALGAHAIATVSGHGYRFDLPVTRTQVERPAPPRHLPFYPTSYVGREQEGRELEKLLSRSRAVTLTGSGGAGKTRLAVETAGKVAASFPDGVWLVELAAIADAALVAQAAAEALGLKEQADRPLLDTVADHLAAKRALLILDNAEHLVAACASFADRLLHRCPSIVVLTTSRERLGITGEVMHRVPSLTVPLTTDRATPDALQCYESVKLFVERARLVRPHFSLGTENAEAVALICQRLDGIPLAIELAAPRLRTMAAEELARRIDQRFALLTGGSRSALPRQRTLRSLIDWSHDLLTAAEQALLSRLSVFAGGWTLAAAEQACAGEGIARDAVLELLASLADKNLIVALDDEAASRYRILETIRQYAGDRLREGGDEARWRGAHLACFTAASEEAFPQLRGAAQHEWLDRLAADHDNVRKALTWSLSEDIEGGLRLAHTFVRFWFLRSHLAEATQWLRDLLDAPACPPADPHRPYLLFAAGQLAILQGDTAGSERRYQQSLALSRELNTPTWTTYALAGLGHLALEHAEYGKAERYLREAVDLARTLTDATLLAATLANLGTVMQARGERTEARAALEEALALVRPTGDRYAVAGKLHILSEIECEEGRLAAAKAYASESLTMFVALGNKWGMAKALESFAEIAIAERDLARAARLWGAAEGLRDETGARMRLDRQDRHRETVAGVRATLGSDAFDQAWHSGRATPIDQLVQQALAVETPANA